MQKRKTRKDKAREYEEKFSHIPIDSRERLAWLYDTLHITEKESYDILLQRSNMLNSLQYYTIDVILFEVPEGSPRPRFRIINRANITNMAISNPNFVHVYSLTGHEDSVFMNRLISSGELSYIDSMIYTPCIVDINAYVKTPSSYNRQQVIMAEIGLDRPINKPDWDNIGKKYSDMFNKNVWLDDTLVTDGAVHKFYSVLPRIEIRIKYLNMLYNKHQYTGMLNRVEENCAPPLYFDYGKGG